MMKKKFIYSLPVFIALAFNGCGSSSTTDTPIVEGDTDSVSVITKYEKFVNTGYSVVVERGAVLDANVSDANGSVAIQVSDTNNTYIFENEPVFPITAEGGWIDVDGDGNLTEADVALDINLTSYTDIITPTTTYCSDENETIREERLQELATETNCTSQELLTVPSKATKNSIIVLNAVYEKLVARENKHSKAPIAIAAILERYTEIDNNTYFDENTTSEEMALSLEAQTMESLQRDGYVETLDSDDIEEIKGKKTKKLKDKDMTENDELIKADEEATEVKDDSTDTNEEATEVKDDSKDNNGKKPEKSDDDDSTDTGVEATELEDNSKDNNGKKPEKFDDDDSTDTGEEATELEDDSKDNNGKKPEK